MLCRAGFAGHVSAVQGRLCWSCECCAGQALLHGHVSAVQGGHVSAVQGGHVSAVQGGHVSAGHVSAVQGRHCWSCECCAGQALVVM